MPPTTTKTTHTPKTSIAPPGDFLSLESCIQQGLVRRYNTLNRIDKTRIKKLWKQLGKSKQCSFEDFQLARSQFVGDYECSLPELVQGISAKLLSLPIHFACHQGCPINIIHTLIKSVPWSVKVADQHGLLPLHCACTANAAPIELDTVQYLADCYPTALLLGTPYCPWNEGLPIHHALQNQVSVEVIRYLVNACPASLHYVANVTVLGESRRETPLELALRWNRRYYRDDNPKKPLCCISQTAIDCLYYQTNQTYRSNLVQQLCSHQRRACKMLFSITTAVNALHKTKEEEQTELTLDYDSDKEIAADLRRVEQMYGSSRKGRHRF